MPSRKKAASAEAYRPVIAAAARETLARWLAEGHTKDARGINVGQCRYGNCEDFAKEVVGSLDDAPEDVQEVDVAMFTCPEDNDFFEGAPFDRELLKRYWPAVQPPEGLTWDDLDELSAAAGFSPGTHIWVTDGKYHYDSECPEGTENFLELPFFQRVIASWVEERDSAPVP